MGRDLYKEAGITIDQPKAAAPRDLYAEAGINPKDMPMNDLPSAVSYPLAFGSGVTKSLTDSLNSVSNKIPTSIQDLFSQNKTDGNFQSFISKLLPPNKINQLSSQAGNLSNSAVKANPFTEKAGEVVGGGLPFMLAPEMAGLSRAGMLPRVALQTGVGAATSDQPFAGGAISGGAEFLNPGANALLQTIHSKLIPPNVYDKAKNLWQIMRGSLGNLSDEGRSQIEGLFHDRALKEATKHNDNYALDFDNSSYVKALQNEKQRIIKDHLAHNPNSPEWNGAIQQLDDWIDAPHYDLVGMIKHNKALNQIYGGQIKTGVKMPEWLPSFAIKNIKNTINENLENTGLSDSVGQMLQQANHATKERVKFNAFRNAKDEKDLLNIYNKMDEKTQKNLFEPEHRDRIRDYELSVSRSNPIYTPEHLARPRDYLKAAGRRALGGAVVGATAQPISFDSDTQ